MGEISLKIKSDFQQAQADFKRLGSTSDTVRAQVEKFRASFKAGEIDKFMDKNKLAATAIRATQGSMAGMQAEAKGLQREIQRLIKKGMDPQDEALQKLVKEYSRLDQQIGKTGQKTGMFGQILGANLASAAIQKGFAMIKGGFSSMLTEARKIEDAEAAFTPLMGGAERAKQMIAELNVAAAETPFQFEALAGVTKQLLPVMNGDIERTVETMKMLGDTAGGNAQKLDSITRGYTKAMLKGKVDMEALNMIAEAGVPIYSELSASMGVSVAEMMKLSSSGKITSEDLTKAFQKMTSEGGIFYQGMIIASKTTSGVLSTMSDALKMSGAVLGQKFLPYIKQAASAVISVAGSFVKWATTGDNLANALTIIGYVLAGVTSAVIAWQVSTALASLVNVGFAATFGGLTVAARAFTAVIAANPIGAIATVITAVVIPAIIYLIKNWDKVKEKFGQVMDSVQYYAAVGWENVKLFGLKAFRAIISGILTIYRPFTYVIDKIIGAFNQMTGKSIPKLSDITNNFVSSIDAQIAKSNSNLSRLHKARMKQLDELAKKQKEAEAGSKAKAKAEEKAAELERKKGEAAAAAAQGEVDHMKASLEAMQNAELNSYAERLKAAEDFFNQKMELEKVVGENMAEWRAEQASLIANNTRMTHEEQLIAMAALDKAVQNQAKKDQSNFQKFGMQTLSNAQSMFSDLQQTFRNMGKESKALAMTLKILSAAEAGINSYLAFTQVLSDTTIRPSWLRIPVAATVLAAGLAQQAKIWSTPLSAETGLDNYTVPDLRQFKNDSYPVRAQGGETVSVTPRGEEPGGSRTTEIYIGEERLFKVMQRGIDTGKVKLNQRNIGRTVFAR